VERVSWFLIAFSFGAVVVIAGLIVLQIDTDRIERRMGIELNEGPVVQPDPTRGFEVLAKESANVNER
jgi:hypothetical protein